MKKLRFKTNINCMGCVNSISPFLKDERQIEHWEVETSNPDKILTVVTTLDKEEVKDLVEKSGFHAEVIP